jgi:hypothetical protein
MRRPARRGDPLGGSPVACLCEPSDQACQRFAWARCRTGARGHEENPEHSGKLPMPLLNPRVAGRANERPIADPVGPIIAKCRVFMTPTLAAAERCHDLHSDRDALKPVPAGVSGGFSVPFQLQRPALLCVPGQCRNGIANFRRRCKATALRWNIFLQSDLYPLSIGPV